MPQLTVKRRRRDRLPGGGGLAGAGPCAGAVHTRVATELLHVASPASRARVGGPQSAGAGSPRLRRLAARSARDLRTPCRGSRTLPPRGRARPGRAGGPRHRRLDRPALGVRSPGRRRRPGDHQHGILSRPRVDRDRQDDANPDPGRGARGQPLPRRRSPRCSRRPPARSTSAALDEYWKAFSTAGGRRGMLELYRSFDLDELKPYARQARGARGAHADPVGSAGRVPPARLRLAFRGADSRRRSSCCSRASAISSSRTSRSAAPGDRLLRRGHERGP